MQRVEARFHVIQSGRQQVVPTFSDLVDTARSLNQDLAAAPGGQVARFETKPYDVAENWPSDVTLPALHQQARTLETLAQWHRALSATLTDLRMAQQAPKTPPCPDGPARFQRETANFDAAKRHVEERAHECVTRPMDACNTDKLAAPPVAQPTVIAECSDVAARRRRVAFQEKRQARQQRRQADIQAQREEQKQQRAADCRGSTVKGCSPCRAWEFTSFEFRAPSHKGSGHPWDVGSAPDPVIAISAGEIQRDAHKADSFELSQRFDPPLVLTAGTVVEFSAIDRDIAANDRIARFDQRVPSRLRGGTWALGAGAWTLRGTCSE